MKFLFGMLFYKKWSKLQIIIHIHNPLEQKPTKKGRSTQSGTAFFLVVSRCFRNSRLIT
jgi:hypothetical protein